MKEHKGVYIEITALMGTGKSSLAKVFNERAGYHALLEREADLDKLFFVEPYLSNPMKYGFEGNLNFLAFHLNRTQERLHALPEDAKVISDSSILTQYAYGKSCLPRNELTTVNRIIRHAYEKLPKVDLWVVPHLPIDLHMQRICMRGRDSEKTVSRDFLVSAEKQIHAALKKFGGGAPVLHLDSSKLNWVDNEDDKKTVLKLARQALGRKF